MTAFNNKHHMLAMHVPLCLLSEVRVMTLVEVGDTVIILVEITSATTKCRELLIEAIAEHTQYITTATI